MLYEVHCAATLEDSIGLRSAAAAKILPPGAVVSGSAAAWVLGVDVRHRTDEPLTVTYPRSNGTSSRRGILVRHALLPDSDLIEVGGVPVTTPLRTAFDLARQPNLIEDVVALDALLQARLITRESFAAYVEDHPRWRGVRLAARALALAEPATESPMESRLRMVIVIPGLPPPEPQIARCSTTGEEIARIDLGHRDARKGYEYDGRDHAASYSADSRRRNAIWYDFGWDLRHYGSADVYRRPQSVVAHVARVGLPPPPIPPIMLHWLSFRGK
jgi:AbiEi antitoxin C-terminal domain